MHLVGRKILKILWHNWLPPRWVLLQILVTRKMMTTTLKSNFLSNHLFDILVILNQYY